jgi:hypothetical protein
MLVLWISTIAVVAWCLRPRRPRRLYVRGLGRTTVRLGEEVTISSMVDCDFRPTQLLVPSSSAEGFLIREVLVRGIPQLSSTAGLPAILFSEEAESPRLLGTLARAGEDVIVIVKNSGEADGDFVGAVLGEVPQMWWEWLFFRLDARWRPAVSNQLRRRKLLMSSLYGKMGSSVKGRTD